MPLEFNCPACGRQLRIPDEHAGKQARCPGCGNVTQAPASNAFPPLSSSPGFSNSGSAPVGQNSFSQNPGSANPFADAPTNPYSAPGQQNYAPFAGTPHRSGTVLGLAIAGFVCCQIFSIAAWIMGQNDLRAMNNGTMDPSGRGMTQAGMILGIIGTIIMAIGLFFFAIGMIWG